MLFPVDKKLVFSSQNKELSEKYVPVNKKTASLTAVWENGRNGFPLARKPVFIS